MAGGRFPKKKPLRWTSQQEDTLRTLWSKGRGLRKIVQTLRSEGLAGVGEGDVVTKTRELELPQRNYGPNTIKFSPPEDPGSIPPSRTLSEPSEGVTLLQLTERSCRFPYGAYEDKATLFCGKINVPGSPFCPQHREIAVQKKENKRRAP